MENSDKTQNLSPSSTAKLLSAIAVCCLFYWIFFAGGDVKLAQPSIQQATNQVADDAVQQYEIAKRSKHKMQMYTQAEMAAQAFLQAKDEANYNIWQIRADSIGKKLGMQTP